MSDYWTRPIKGQDNIVGSIDRRGAHLSTPRNSLLGKQDQVHTAAVDDYRGCPGCGAPVNYTVPHEGIGIGVDTRPAEGSVGQVEGSQTVVLDADIEAIA